MTFAAILQAIIFLPAIFKAISALIKSLEDHFGPDWISKINDIQAANEKLQNAVTPEDKDAALKSIAHAFYRKP